jgi:hypothetical protein
MTNSELVDVTISAQPALKSGTLLKDNYHTIESAADRLHRLTHDIQCAGHTHEIIAYLTDLVSYPIHIEITAIVSQVEPIRLQI